MKNLELIGVQEMNTQEMREVDGGLPFWQAVGGFLITLALVILIVVLL